MSEGLEVILAPIVVSRVNDLASREEDEPIEEGDDVASGLMDSEDNGPLVIPGEGDK